MVRVRLKMAMEEFNEAAGKVSSVGDVFEAAGNWSKGFKEVKNAYPAEFQVVFVPKDLALASECVPELNPEAVKKSKEKFYATEFREKIAGRNTVISLLWVEERKYWRIVAISALDGSDAEIAPYRPPAPEAAETAPEKTAGDPAAIKDITAFYDSWIAKRDVAAAMQYVSARSYGCLSAASMKGEKGGAKPSERVRTALEQTLTEVPRGTNLAELLSGVQPVNELVRPVGHEPIPSEAKYGSFYTTASRLNLGDEEPPALILLWAQERKRWKVTAWAIEVP